MKVLLILAAVLLSIFAAFALYWFASYRDRAASSDSTTALDAGAAARLAASLANVEASRQFKAAPFEALRASPTFSEGRWKWQATAGYGKGDLQASVSFTRTGSKPEVSVQILSFAPPEPREFKQ